MENRSNMGVRGSLAREPKEELGEGCRVQKEEKLIQIQKQK